MPLPNSNSNCSNVEESKGKLLAANWFSKANSGRYLHYACANFFNRLHYFLGIPTVILSGVVGTAVFASLGKDVTGDWTIVIGLTIRILAAVLASLQTFLGFSERAEKRGESLFLRKLVLGIPAQASGKNLTRPLMPSAPQTSCVRATSPLSS